MVFLAVALVSHPSASEKAGYLFDISLLPALHERVQVYYLPCL